MLTKGNSRFSPFQHCSGEYRSGLEKLIQQQLKDAGILSEYEPGNISYIRTPSRYTPDFILPNGIVIETKGYFTGADRTKHLLIQAQYPDIDLRFVFQNPNTKLSKTSKTTYAMWCDKHGFPYAVKWIPEVWLKEPCSEKSITVLREVLKRAKWREKLTK